MSLFSDSRPDISMTLARLVNLFTRPFCLCRYFCVLVSIAFFSACDSWPNSLRNLFAYAAELDMAWIHALIGLDWVGFD